ncbi:MAG TPA: hypothetical protein VMA09_01970 [Candidatus Binataceae bacterium]|nr:hypothetical protein [Candidatus Binataceae bacterium]
MRNSTITSAAALAAALLFAFPAPRALAYDMRRPMREQKDLPPALIQSLQDHLSDEAGPYFDEQDKRKADKQTYVDLQMKFEYLPTYGPHHQVTVSAKMGGAEYDPNKPGSSKGAATGTLKYLVFTYALENGKWVEIAKPKWEKQALGAAAGAKMTGNIARGDKRQAAQQKAAQTHAAAAAAAAAAQQAADHAGGAD